MDSMEPNDNKNFSNDMSIENSVPLSDFIQSDFFEEQEILPRIGEDYQVEIPQLVEKSDYISYIKNPEKTENSALELLMGLPVPLRLITRDSRCLTQERLEVLHDSKVSNESGLEESENIRKKLRSEVIMDTGTASGGSTDIALEKKLHESSGAGLSLVPGSASESWNDAEKESFLLGLYIFEKNFVRVRRFIGGKKMGDILAFYYGKFYRSPEYCRWSECRKMRSRKYIYGQRIFTGMRLQELLSRILPSVSEECKNTLLEVSKMFGEGKMSFEEYVFSLKAMVGMSILVEAVGIGKGKQDLTGMALESLRSNHVIAMRPEIPTGKACSSLTSSEIVKYLTGDYRLSKARSNDLFWEAVWPRLLARGWHSEEPKDQVYATASKNSLVFLMPGVKKFSRRRLVKGIHYFDSITDVLSKVASEPGLIELDNEEDQSKKNKEEYEWNHDAKLEEDDTPTRRRQYLQPRTPNRTTNGMKFTVVDTSLGDGKPYKVRELRSLPFEIPNKLNSRSCVEVSDEDTPEVSTDQSDAVDNALPDKNESDNAKASNSLSNGELVSDAKDLEISAPEQEMHMACANSDGAPVNDSINNTHLIADKQLKKVVKHHLNRSMKEDNLDNIAPVTKRRRRLTACSRGETSNFVTNSSVVLPRLKPEMPTCNSVIHNSPSQAVSSRDKLSLTSSSRSSLSESVDCFPIDNCHVVIEPPRNQRLIDLNLPQVPLDFENGVLMTDATGESDDKSKNIGNDDVSLMSHDVTGSEQQSSMNPQRRSTRNRPPTTRALEALANGFLTVNSRRKKTKEEISRENLASRSSRCARGVGLTEVCSNSVDSMAEGSENSASIDKDKNASPEFQVFPEENRVPTSGL